MEIQFEWAMDSLGDARKVIHINDAQSKHIYWCPDCKGRMFPRLGEIRSHHFAHATDFHHTGESQIHAAAKERIAQVIREWKQCAILSPKVISKFYSDASEIFGTDPTPYEAQLEYRFGNNRRADVMILQNSEPLFGIEVYHSHFSDEDKSAEYEVSGIPWIEVRAISILFNPLVWKDIRSLPQTKEYYNEVGLEGRRAGFRIPWWGWTIGGAFALYLLFKKK